MRRRRPYRFVLWRKKGRKAPFYLNQEDVAQFPYADYYYITDIKEQLNLICSVSNVRKATNTIIWNYLVEAGLTVEQEGQGGYVKIQTKQGRGTGNQDSGPYRTYGIYVSTVDVSRACAADDHIILCRAKDKYSRIKGSRIDKHKDS